MKKQSKQASSADMLEAIIFIAMVIAMFVYVAQMNI